MELALAERFICPCGVSRMPLVVRADEAAAGTLLRGEAGCAQCTTEWPLEQDHAVFGVRAAGDALAMADVDAAIALLDLHEPGLCLWLDGATVEFARALGAASGAQLVLADALALIDGALHVDGAAQVPFGTLTFHAALILRVTRSPEYMVSVAQALVPGGRLVAAECYAVPPGTRLLAAAHPLWVGEGAPQVTPVALRRR
jgi:hypothetical protein